MSLGLERQREQHGHPHHEEIAGRSIAAAVHQIDELTADQARLRAALGRKADAVACLRADLDDALERIAKVQAVLDNAEGDLDVTYYVAVPTVREALGGGR